MNTERCHGRASIHFNKAAGRMVGMPKGFLRRINPQCSSSSSAWVLALTSSTTSVGALQMNSARRVRQSSDRM